LFEDWQDSYQSILVFPAGMKIPIQLIGHQWGVWQVIQQNKRSLVSIGLDNTLRIWDKSTGIPKRVIGNFSKEPYYISFLNLRNKVNNMFHVWVKKHFLLLQ
jgi:hypothetical protein